LAVNFSEHEMAKLSLMVNRLSSIDIFPFV
jgi:hypothetical protein